MSAPRELIFTSRLGSAVLDLDWKPVVELAVGQQVIVPSLFGHYTATITVVKPFGETFAETEGLIFPLYAQGGEWWCASSVSKQGLAELGRAVK